MPYPPPRKARTSDCQSWVQLKLLELSFADSNAATQAVRKQSGALKWLNDLVSSGSTQINRSRCLKKVHSHITRSRLERGPQSQAFASGEGLVKNLEVTKYPSLRKPLKFAEFARLPQGYTKDCSCEEILHPVELPARDSQLVEWPAEDWPQQNHLSPV